MAVADDRSMNFDFKLGAVDHTIRLAAGQDRGGITDVANYYNHLVGSDTSINMTGDHLVKEYLRGIVAHP